MKHLNFYLIKLIFQLYLLGSIGNNAFKASEGGRWMRNEDCIKMLVDIREKKPCTLISENRAYSSIGIFGDSHVYPQRQYGYYLSCLALKKGIEHANNNRHLEAHQLFMTCHSQERSG